MKAILVPVEPHNAIQSVLETALLLGQKFDSHIQALALLPASSNIVTMDPVNSLTMIARENDLEIIKQARAIFEAFIQERQVPRMDATNGALSFDWIEGTADGDNSIGSYGRVFDIIVLGRPGGGRQGPRMATLEAALFETGRPVLLAPPIPPKTIGDNILIAWNCSTEQARATASAMPLLRKASRVTICTVEGATVPGPTGEQIARYLALNDVRVETIIVAPGQRRPGEVILTQAEAIGCDLVVKGAYTQSRLRQMIFGGTTQHIITHATLPVLLAH